MATYKSKPVEFLDEFFSGPDLANRLNYARSQLLKPGPLADTTSDLGGALPAPLQALPAALHSMKNAVAARKSDFITAWLGAIPGSEQRMRKGYLDAVNYAIGPPPKPLETFWVSDEPRFYLEVTNAPNKVTVHVHTPLHRPPRGSLGTASVTWLIGYADTDDPAEVSVEQISGFRDESAD